MENFNEPTDKLILIYGTGNRGISTSTLTITLEMFQDVFYRINEILYPDEQAEFIIEKIEEGSFWVTFRKVAMVAVSITTGVFSNIIYSKYFSTQNPPLDGYVIMNGNNAVVKIGDTNFSIPIDSLDAYRTIRKDNFINSRIVESFGMMKKDDKVAYFALAADNTRVEKPELIPHENFDKLSQTIEIKSKQIVHPDTFIEVISTSFKQPIFSGTFKWEDKIIHAKITDNSFTFSPGKRSEIFHAGKRLNVRMVETKSNDHYTNEMIHSQFEIVEVYR